MGRPSLVLVCLQALLVPVALADVSVFVGPKDGEGDVLVLDEQGRESRPDRLQHIVLLPLDFQGRTRLDELLPERPRLRGDIPGGVRLQLPLGQGSLYRYRRDDSSDGSSAFGFFLVDPDGAAHSVFELMGVGLLQRGDPIEPRLSVSPQGDAILIATRLETGGDLIEIDLMTARATNRTEDLAPLSFRANGMCLLSTWGIGLADTGPLRFQRTPAAQAVPVPAFPVGLGWIGEDVVSSADESTAAMTAGPGRTRASVYVFGATGEAKEATRTPANVCGAGFLPDETEGPRLALSTDGSLVAWCTDAGSSRECWMRATRAASSAPEIQVTGDAHFEDTLNETGVIAFASPDDMIVLVGEREGAQTEMEKADLFRVRMGSSGSLSFKNLSRTAQSNNEPFGYGRLELESGIYRLPGSTWLAWDPGEPGRDKSTLLRVQTQGGPDKLLSRVHAPQVLEVAGNTLYASMEGTSPDALQFIRLALDERLPTLWTLPGGSQLNRAAALLSSSEFAAVLVSPDGERLGRVSPTSGAGRFVQKDPCAFGPTIGFSKSALHATIHVQGSWAVLSWSQAGTSVLRHGFAQAFLLPGI